MQYSPTFLHLKTLCEGEEGYTLHVYTAGGEDGYTLHVHTAYGKDEYTLLVYIADGEGWIVDTPCTSTLMMM
jgi:hypothetical protein